MVTRDQDLDANIVRWGLHHLLDPAPSPPLRPPSPAPHHRLRPAIVLDPARPPRRRRRRRWFRPLRPPSPGPHHRLRSPADTPPRPTRSGRLRRRRGQDPRSRERTTRSSRTRSRRSSPRSPWPRPRGATPPPTTSSAPPYSRSSGSFRTEIMDHLPSAPPYVEEEEEGSSERFSTCSSPEDGNGQSCPIELVEDFSALGGEVGKRLNDMLPVPHVPKTNGEIPSVDEAFSDHRRLLDRLVLYGLVELKVNGDGNCQSRALSDQFYRTTEHHRFVRQQVMKQLESHPEIYAGYVPMDYREYLKKMPKNGEWGDHVTLQAAADSG